LANRPQHKRLWPGGGGYAAVYPVSDEVALALTTDGVGTKLLVAHELKSYRGLGIDLVAMCANDLICVGATPTLFLDYFAVGALDDAVADQLIEGIVEGCDQAQMFLAGGETAEMPDLYAGGHFDLAGFALGQLTKDKLISGESIKPGQTLIGVGSSGIHSNGFSLARKVVGKNHDMYKELLTPTKIYVKPALKALAEFGAEITGMAHITGGGWRNLFRLNDAVGFRIEKPLPVPAIFQCLSEKVAQEEMYKTFNMGMGLSLIVKGQAEKIVRIFEEAGCVAAVVGTVTAEPEKLSIANSNVVLSG
jgi:phosphoribosylformylglycinamidine cyclo-ligase